MTVTLPSSGKTQALKKMQFIGSEVTKLFAIGFAVGALMVGAASASNWGEELSPQAHAHEQEVTAPAGQ